MLASPADNAAAATLPDPRVNEAIQDKRHPQIDRVYADLVDKEDRG